MRSRCINDKNRAYAISVPFSSTRQALGKKGLELGLGLWWERARARVRTRGRAVSSRASE